jgi:hypothetical protein
MQSDREIRSPIRAMNFQLHLPLFKVILSVTFAYSTAVGIHLYRDGEISVSWISLLWLLAGGIYTHLFEYVYHSLGMHRSIRFRGSQYYDKRHLRHHRLFFGENFQTRQSALLKEVATSWYTLPVLFFLHYFAFLALFPARHALWFFLGVTVQSLAYEISHWFTHVKDNSFDRVLARVPLLSRLRAAQIRHHRQHHAVPTLNFNFTPPYLGDRLGRTHSK